MKPKQFFWEQSNKTNQYIVIQMTPQHHQQAHQNITVNEKRQQQHATIASEQQDVIAAPMQSMPTIHITHNTMTKCGDFIAPPPKIKTINYNSEHDTTPNSDEDSDNDDISFNALLPSSIGNLNKMNSHAMRSMLINLLAQQKQRQHRRSVSRGHRFPIQSRTIHHRVRHATHHRNHIPTTSTTLSRVVKLAKKISWPIVCLASAYAGHSQYYQNISPIITPLLSTLSAFTAKY